MEHRRTVLDIKRGGPSTTKGRELVVELSAPLPQEAPRDWIHLPTMTRIRLKAFTHGDQGPTQARIKGLGRGVIKRSDILLPVTTPLVCSRRFYGSMAAADRRAAQFELKTEGRFVGARLSSAGGKAGIMLLETVYPLALRLGQPLRLPIGDFVPLTSFMWANPGKKTPPFKAQGWLPAGVAPKNGGIEGDYFTFFAPWIEWVRGRLCEAARIEGGAETAEAGRLIGLPPYVLPDLLGLLVRRGWFTTKGGVLLDAHRDYSNSLSPMCKGVLNELNESCYLIDKLADSPRRKALGILERTGLAVEIEDGVFMETGCFDRVYRRVAELRGENPDIGLSDLARETGIKKRFLIALLHYGDRKI